MLIRFRHWAVAGVPAHKAIRGSSEYVFLDTDQGLCDVRDREGIEYLLARSVNYELAYERYGVTFVNGQEVETVGVGSVTPEEPSSKRKPGRPCKE